MLQVVKTRKGEHYCFALVNKTGKDSTFIVLLGKLHRKCGEKALKRFWDKFDKVVKNYSAEVKLEITQEVVKIMLDKANLK